MKITREKKNMRRKFFNFGKGIQCPGCGSLLVGVTNLLGRSRGTVCPIGCILLRP